MNRKPKLSLPTADEDEDEDEDEDAAIVRGIAGDPDAVELTTEQIKGMQPAREVFAEVLGEEKADALIKRRGRPALPATERKVSQTLRLDPDVLQAFKASGDGWQTRINDALRAYAKSHRMLPQGC